MLKEETVTGSNARRVMNGEAPVKEARGEDELTREKELTHAYFQMSLVDHYSMKDGALVVRVPEEELRTNYQEAMKACLEGPIDPIDHAGSADHADHADHTDSADSADSAEMKEARELEKLLLSFTTHDRKKVLDKYSVLLYNHSLERINVDEVLDHLKEKH